VSAEAVWQMAAENRYQLSLFQRFQENFEEKTNQQKGEAAAAVGPEMLVAQRRRSLDEAELRRSIAENVGHIVNTIDLQSALDVSPYSYVRKSILNFGLYDFHGLASEGQRTALIEQNVTAAVMYYEPRIVGGTIRVERRDLVDDVSQRLELALRADVKAHPVDFEIELTAEVDLSSGKIQVTKGSS
jgi:type VI secretion system protein ImpF